MANSYTNPGGSGNRTASITVTTNIVAGQGSVSMLVNGLTGASEYWFSAQPGGTAYIQFDFGTQRNITEATWYQSQVAAHGTWKWQGSNDGSAYTDIGGTFTLGSAATQVISTLSGNASTWRYYRLQQTAGSISTAPWVNETEFSIDTGAAAPKMNPAALLMGV